MRRSLPFPPIDRASPEDAAIDFSIPAGTFTDVDSPVLTLSARLSGGAALPGWLGFANGRFTGTPPLDFNGAFTVEVIASDGALTASALFKLTITPVNDAPGAHPRARPGQQPGR